MTASFPWYDLPSVRWANDVVWRATGLAGALCRNRMPADLWQDPKLLITQACGLDLFLTDALIAPIAAPVFDLDCAPGMYYSHIVGNRNGQVAAVNSLTSHSGYSALLARCKPSEIVVTGSHTASLGAIQSGAAEVAAIDAVTWKILLRDQPQLVEGVNIVGRSADAPSPPYVVRKAVASNESQRAGLYDALQFAFASRACVDAKRALCTTTIKAVTKADYASILACYKRLPTQERV